MPCACGVQEISLESENPLTRHFDRLADGLWLFLDIHDRVRRLGDEEQAMARNRRFGKKSYNRSTQEPDDGRARGLRDFLKQAGTVGRLFAGLSSPGRCTARG